MTSTLNQASPVGQVEDSWGLAYFARPKWMTSTWVAKQFMTQLHNWSQFRLDWNSVGFWPLRSTHHCIAIHSFEGKLNRSFWSCLYFTWCALWVSVLIWTSCCTGDTHAASCRSPDGSSRKDTSHFWNVLFMTCIAIISCFQYQYDMTRTGRGQTSSDHIPDIWCWLMTDIEYWLELYPKRSSSDL